jgi:hypothetical protein
MYAVKTILFLHGIGEIHPDKIIKAKTSIIDAFVYARISMDRLNNSAIDQ